MFPLLQLNPAARNEVFRLFTPVELFVLSLASKSCHRLIREFLKTTHEQYSITIDSSYEQSVDINPKGRYTQGQWTFSIYDRSVLEHDDDVQQAYGRFWTEELKGSEFIGYTQIKNRVALYWRDTDTGFKLLIEYLLNLFSQKPQCLLLKHIEDVRFLDWVKARAGRFLDCIEVDLEFVENQRLSQALDRLQLMTNKINFISLAGKESQINFDRIKNYKEIGISDGHWISLPRLLKMSSAKVSVSNSDFTSRNLNVFLGKWLAKEACQNLKELTLEVENMEISKALSGLPVSELEKHKISEEIHHTTCKITRVDGIEASLHFRSLAPAVHIAFELKFFVL